MSLPEDEHYPTDEEKDRKEPKRRTRRMRGRELRIVQGRDVFTTMDLDDLRRLRESAVGGNDLNDGGGLGRLNAWEEFW